MKKRSPTRVYILLLFWFLPIRTVMAGEKPLVVFVSVLPQAAFVEALAHDRVRVEVMVPAGRSHEVYEPTPRQMQALTQAKIYFRIGLPFEDVWMNKLQANNPGLTVVDTRRGITLLAAPQGEAHASAGGKDPHIWLDPNLVKIQAVTMADALAAADPAHRLEYRRNLQVFTQALTQLDRELRATLSRRPHARLMVYHPAWGYFARAYALVQIPIEVEGKEPGPRSLARLIDSARAQGIKSILVQPEISSKSAQTIAQAIGAQVVPADALPADYFNTLRRLARQIAGDPL